MAAPDVFADPTSVRLVTPRGSAHVEVHDHTLRAQCGDASWHLSASRAGLSRLVSYLGRALAFDDVRHGPLVRDAVMAALRRVSKGKRLGPVERQILSIRETPLLFSQPFLDAEWLHEDARKFAACRTAIALLETDDDDPRVSGAEALVERLKKWRKLYLTGGAAKKTMNRVLSQLEELEGLDPAIVWGLRNVKLTQPVRDRTDLELLGAIGAHPRAAQLGAHVRLIERTELPELEAALHDMRDGYLSRVATVSPAHVAADVLAWAPIAEDASFARVFSEALERVAGELSRGSAQFPLPPFRLPEDPALTWISNVSELQAEGMRMGHCVGHLASAALEGRSFFFHFEYQGEHATIDVDAHGRVREARGPRNGKNIAVTRARQIIENKLKRSIANDAKLWLGNRATPRGAFPVMMMKELYQAFDRLPPSGRQGFSEWATAYAEEARRGRAWMVRRPIAGVDAFMVLDKDGAVIARWTAR